MRFAIALSSAAAITAVAAAKSSLWVDQAPSYVRPYVIEHYANAQSCEVGAQNYRFYVTGASSGGAFSLLGTNSPSSTALGVLPHQHETHHENFFCYKGRFQLWADKYNDSEARLFTPGDYGSVPINTTHTYQLLDPDTELTGVIFPGGFEDLFFAIADRNVSYVSETPYRPEAVSDAAGSGSSASLISTLESFDVYAQLEFTPRRDIVNGSSPSNTTWHSDANSIPSVAGEPYFIAGNYGPKYLTKSSGTWHIIQPFVTPVTGATQNFTQGSIIISRQVSNATVEEHKLSGHTAFQVLEGSLRVTIGGETATLIGGDVAFIPSETSFRYWSEVAFTKFMYVSAGTQGLDQQLLSGASSCNYTAIPVYDA